MVDHSSGCKIHKGKMVDICGTEELQNDKSRYKVKTFWLIADF